jgi:hypothetical protein
MSGSLRETCVTPLPDKGALCGRHSDTGNVPALAEFASFLRFVLV